jgi:hypothetical protein
MFGFKFIWVDNSLSSSPNTDFVIFHVDSCQARIYYCIDGGTQYTSGTSTFSANVPMGNHSICVDCASSHGTQGFTCSEPSDTMHVYISVATGGGSCSCTQP